MQGDRVLIQVQKTGVLLFSSSFLPVAGGLQYELKWYLDALDRAAPGLAGFQFDFLCPNEAGLEYSRFESIGVHNLGLTRNNRVSVAGSILRIGRLLRSLRPRVVHCQAVLPDALWVIAAARIFRVKVKVVATSHGEDIVVLPEISYGMRMSRRSRFLARMVTRRLDAHLLPSQAIKPFALDAGTGAGRITIIPNGIPLGDEPDFEMSGSATETRDEITPPGSADPGRTRPFTVFSMASGRPVKNLDVLVRAFARAMPQLGDCRLLLACIGPASVPIHRLVEELGIGGSVEFTGELSGNAKRERFLSSDVYCLVSKFENCPVSLMEAMKYGSVVVGSRVGGIPEIVEHGHNGLLVEPGSTGELAEALVRLRNETQLRRDLAETAAESVRKYSMSRYVESHLDVYRRLSAEGR